MRPEDLAAKYGTSPAAPRGYEQPQSPGGGGGVQDQVSQLREQARNRGRTPVWQTGGAYGGTSNGFSTEFNRRMQEQEREAIEQGNLNKLYARSDFTGVALYDAHGRKFGHVYEDGQDKGSIYGQMKEQDADLILGQYMLEKDELRRINDPKRLRERVQERSRELKHEIDKGVTAQQFEAATQKRLDEWNTDETAADDWGAIAAGAGGGAAAGAGAGAAVGSFFFGAGAAPGAAIGAAVGGLVGGVGAWLNRDELVNQAARATVKYDMSLRENNHGVASVRALGDFAGMGFGLLDPVGQAVRGSYDALYGETGDDVSAWYEVDPTTGESDRGWGWDAANLAGMFTSGMGMMGAKAARMVFTGVMGGAVASSAGSLALTGESFDDRAGRFDNIYLDDEGDFDLGSSAAGWGAVGMEAAQMLTFRGLGKAVDDRANIFAPGADNALGGAKRADLAGFTYRTDADGNLTRRLSVSGMFAPSEMLQGVTASMLTRRQALKRQTGAATVDDHYRMAQRMVAGGNTRATILTTAMAEGYEEGIQAILEPLSHHAPIDWNEVGMSALSGAAMGAGMGTTAGIQMNRGDKYWRVLADQQATQAGRSKYSDAEWNSLSQEEKQIRATADPEQRKIVKAALENIAKDQTASVYADSPVPEAHLQSILNQVQAREAATLAPRTDESFRISQHENPEYPTSSVAGSLRATMQLLKTSWKSLKDAAAVETDPALKDSMLKVIAESKTLESLLSPEARAAENATTIADRNTAIGNINRILTNWFNGHTDAPTPEMHLARARAASAFFVRFPVDNLGSFQPLQPFVSPELTTLNVDTALQVSPDVLDPLGGDFDGDKIVQLARLIVDDGMYQSMRKGAGYQSVDGPVLVPARPAEEWEVRRLATHFATSPTSAGYREATAATAAIKRRLVSRYGQIDGFEREIDKLISDLMSGDTTARDNFMTRVNTLFAEQMQTLDPNGLTNEWHIISRMVNQELRRFQARTAGRLPAKTKPLVDVTPPRVRTEAYDRQLEGAVTEGLSMANASNGHEMFRIIQTAKPVVNRVAVESSDAATNNKDLQDLVNVFLMMDQGIDASRDMVEQIQASNEISARVQAKLQLLSDDILAQTGQYVAPAALAVSQIANFDSRGNFHSTKKGDSYEISLVQSLLREEVLREQDRYGAALSTLPEVQARLDALLSLTQPNRDVKGSKKVRNVGAAMVEVFGGTPIPLMDLEAGQTLGPDLSFEQYAGKLVGMSSSARADEIRAMRSNPRYFGTTDPKAKSLPYSSRDVEEGGITAYRAIVDALDEYANHQLSMIREGASMGTPTGVIADSSRRSGAALRTSLANFGTMLKKLGRPATSKNIQRTLKEYPAFYEDLLKAFVDDKVARAFFKFEETDGTTAPSLLMSSWLTEALTMEPAQAEMFLLKNMLLASWNGMGSVRDLDDAEVHARDFDRMDDRIHQLMAILQTQNDGGTLLQAFLVDLDAAKTVEEFEQLLNVKYAARFNLPPFTAWRRDVADVDPYRRQGIGVVLSGAQQREAIGKLAATSKAMLQTVTDRLAQNAADAALVARMRADRASGYDSAPRQKLARVLKLAQRGLNLMSPADREKAVVGAYTMLFKGGASKGGTPTPFVGLARFEAGLEYFGTPFEQTLGSLTARDLDTVMKHPNMSAAGAIQTTDYDGFPITIPQLDEDFILDNWDRPELQEWLKGALTPLVSEATQGGVTYKYLTEPSLSNLLGTDDIFQQIQQSSNNALYGTYLDSMSMSNNARYAFSSRVLDVMYATMGSIERPLTGTEADEQTLSSIFRHSENGMANFVRMLGALSTHADTGEFETPLERVGRQIKQELHTRFLSKSFDIPGDSAITREALVELLEARFAEARLSTFLPSAPAAAPTKGQQRSRDLVDLAEAMVDGNIVDTVIEMFGFHSGTIRKTERQLMLMRILEGDPTILSRTPWAQREITQILTTQEKNAEGIPFLADDIWKTASRAVIANFLDQSANGVRAASSFKLQEFPDWEKRAKDPSIEETLRHWDPTRFSLIEDLFDPANPVIEAAREIHLAAGTSLRPTADATAKHFLRTFVEKPEDGAKWHPYMGEWTVDEPRAQKSGDQRFRAAGSEGGVSQGGITEKKVRFMAARFPRSFKHPEPLDSALSRTSFDASLLFGQSEFAALPGVQLPGGAVSTHEPFALLNGRFVNEATVTLADGTVVDLMSKYSPTAPPLGVTYLKTTNDPHPTLRAINLEQLQAAVEKVVEDATPAGAPADMTGVQVQLGFLHPDTRPDEPDMYGNIYYDGVATKAGSSDVFPSLESTLYDAPGGLNRLVQQWALQAQKKGTYGIQLANTVSADLTALFYVDWQQNLSRVIHGLTSEAIKLQDGDKKIPTILYNAVLQVVRRSIFIRGVDKATGEPVLWPASRLLAKQAADPNYDISAELDLAEVYVPSDEVARTLYGGAQEYVTPNAVGRTYSSSLQSVKPFQGEFSAEELATLPGILALNEDGTAWQTREFWEAKGFRTTAYRTYKQHPGFGDVDLARLQRLNIQRANQAQDIQQARSESRVDWRAKRAANSARVDESFNEDEARVQMEFAGRSAASLLYTNGATEKALLNGYVSAIDGSENQMVWEVRGRTVDTNKEIPTQGIHTGDTITKTSGAHAIAPSDIANLNVDSFLSDDLRTVNEELLRSVIRALSNTGATINLYSPNKQVEAMDLAAAVLRELPGYAAVPGSSRLFREDRVLGISANERARQSSLYQMQSINFQEMMLVAAMTSNPLAENGAGLVGGSSRTPKQIVYKANILPTNEFGDFAVPSEPALADDVSKSLQSLLSDPERVKLLKKQAGIDKKSEAAWERDIAELQERLQLNEGADALIDFARLERGTFIPLVRTQGNRTEIILYRHGHKKPKDAEVLKQLEESGGIGGSGRLRIAVYGTKTTGTELTLNTGEVLKVDRRARGGLTVLLRKPVKGLGGKFQLNLSGFKVVLSSLTKKVLDPVSTEIVPGKELDLVTNLDDMLGKNSNEGDTRNFGGALAFAGMDFTSHLVEFFFKVRPGDKGYEAAIPKLEELLVAMERRLPRQSDRAVMMSSRTGLLPTQIIESLALLDPSGVRPTWLSDLENAQALTDQNVQTPGTEARTIALAGIAAATINYLTSPVRRDSRVPLYQHILANTGIGEAQAEIDRARGQIRPLIFTDTLDRLPFGHPTRRLLLADLNAKLSDGYAFDETLQLHVEQKDGTSVPVNLYMTQVFTSGDDPALDEDAVGRGNRQQHSDTTESMIELTTGGKLFTDRDFEAAQRLLSREGVSDMSTTQEVWEALTDFEMTKVPRSLWRSLKPGEHEYLKAAEDVGLGYRTLIDLDAHKDKYSAAEHEALKEEITKLTREIGTMLNLRKGQRGMIHYWVRQVMGAAAPRSPEEPELSLTKVRAGLEHIKKNITLGYLPTVDGDVRGIHYSDLVVLYNAARTGKGLRLKTGLRSNEHLDPDDWGAWVDLALAFSQTGDRLFDPMYLTASDFLFQSYRDKSEALTGLPVSTSRIRATTLQEDIVSETLVSLDPNRAATLGAPIMINETLQDFGAIFGARYIEGRWETIAAPESELAEGRQRRARWRKKNKIAQAELMNTREFVKTGTQLREYEINMNGITRIAMNLRAGTALVNPLLWTSAIFEMFQRGLIDTATNILLGQKLNGIGTWEAKLIGTKGGAMYTPEQLQKIDRTLEGLGSRAELKKMIYGDLMFVPDYTGHGIIERWTRKFARAGSFMQDPTWGMRGKALARRYVEASLQYIAADPTSAISIDVVMNELNKNPQWLKQTYPEAHKAGLAVVANNRSLKQQPLSMALNGILDPLASNSNGLVSNMSIWMGKIPLMFANYMSNVVIAHAGLQGPAAFLSILLDGRKKGMIGGLQSWLAGEGWKKHNPDDPDAPIFDMSAAIEGLDLTRAFLQGGVTHSGLFLLATIAGGLGMDGEDEEERRRRLAAKYQHGFDSKDPSNIINDWRNADELYLDWLPFGLGALFAVPQNEDGTNTAGSMANMHWVMRQFVSPILGIQKAFDTGDFRHIFWGYQDALGSMPLFNAQTWSDVQRTTELLMATAPDADAEERLDAGLDALGVAVNIVMLYESMLLESSFVNQLVIGFDKYDRDPWVIPEIANGEIVRNRLDVPEETNALVEFQDPETGEIRMGTKGRDWMDATMHGFTENRQTLALLMSSFTGLSDSSYWRNNMAIKTREIDLEGMSDEQASNLAVALYESATGGNNFFGDDSYVMSAYNESGEEVLTGNGAAAIIRGLWKGTVTADSPALRGIYMDKPQRERIQAYFMETLIQEGLDLGLSEYDAKGRMYDIWNGPQEYPDVPGIADLIWDPNLIPYSPREKYYQLNTTYIQGPDGNFYATGLQRNSLTNAFGLAPLQRYYNGEPGLPTDSRLNAMDAGGNLNTGIRGLEKVDESWHIPTDEEIAETITKGIEDALKKTFTGKTDSNGYGGYGGYGRGGGGGGGGGGGYASWYRLSSPERNNPIYGSNDPFIRTDNPNIRRATIRRERYTSQRGRLNQWQ